MSIGSRKFSFFSQLMVGDIVVGRVRVATRTYEIVPRSNYKQISRLPLSSVVCLTSRLLGKREKGN